MSWLYTGIGYVLQFCYKLTNNYGLALILFAFFFKLILFPFGYKQQKNQYRMALLRPKQAAIEKKYAGRNDQPTLRKKQMEIQQLYQKEGVNPMGGCLPMLLQFPIIIALYNVIRSPLTYLMGLGKEGGHIVVNAIYEITGKSYKTEIDALRDIMAHKDVMASHSYLVGKELPNFRFLALDLSVDPNMAFDRYLLVPIITFLGMFATMWLTQKLSMNVQQQTAEQKQSMLMMNLMMPIMSTIFTFSVPTAVALYWFAQNVFGVLQQLILYKAIPAPTFTEEDFQKAEDALFGKNRKKKKSGESDPSRPRPRSLHHIDDEDAPTQPHPVQPQKKKTPAQKEQEKRLLDGVVLQEEPTKQPQPTQKEETEHDQ